MYERRLARARLELRASPAGSDSPGTITGYASVYSTSRDGSYGLSGDLGGWKERCMRGCFDKSLASGNDVRALFNHDPSAIIGRIQAGTLALSSDDVGLHFRVMLPDTSYARDLYTSVLRGDVTGASFAFTTEAGGEEWGEEDSDPNDPDYPARVKVRTLRSVNLQDISPVVYPAYESTRVRTDSPQHPFFNSLPLEQMFPQGVPQEVRSHVPFFQDSSRERRRQLTNLFIQ
jgi:HK97 family phage prohead protease